MSTTNQKLIEKINGEILKLPKESQEVINSFDWIKITDEIGGKYNFAEDEINDFQIETALVLVGLVDPDLYVTNIEDEVGITKIESEKIADEILEKVFKPIAKKIEENIKDKIKNKNTKWDQNLNFVLSGGDYSIFAEKAGTTNIINTPKSVVPVYPVFPEEEKVPIVDNIRNNLVI